MIKREIESHSSYRTNDRIDKFLMAVGELSFMVHSTRPNPESAMQYFASVMTLFQQTHPEYSEKGNEDIKKEIDKCMIDANIINSRFQIYNEWSPEDFINLTQLSSRAVYLMVQGLQNMGYFFRHGSQEAKGIDAALEIFNLDMWKKRENKDATESV